GRTRWLAASAASTGTRSSSAAVSTLRSRVGRPWGCAGLHAEARTSPSTTIAAGTLRRMAEPSIMAPRPRTEADRAGRRRTAGDHRTPYVRAARHARTMAPARATQTPRPETRDDGHLSEARRHRPRHPADRCGPALHAARRPEAVRLARRFRAGRRDRGALLDVRPRRHPRDVRRPPDRARPVHPPGRAGARRRDARRLHHRTPAAGLLADPERRRARAPLRLHL